MLIWNKIYIDIATTKDSSNKTCKEKKPTDPQAKKPKNTQLAIMIICLVLVASLTAGIAGYYFDHQTTLLPQSSSTSQPQSSTSPLSDANSTNDTSLSDIYQQTEPSVVVIEDFQTSYDSFNVASTSQVEGSGFIYDLNGQDIIITNYHVINGGSNITVTFQDGNSYSAKVLGSDPYSDLAVLSANAPQSELVPLTITSSTDLHVGDQVEAIGSPYGLTGSMTSGIISALNRTITEDTANGYAISDIIQTSTAINPGNSGGPLLNSQGQVIGITTAVLDDSQGLGFAIPSDTILREITDLTDNGSYTQHSYLGISGADMTYDIAAQMKVSVTYGVLLQAVTSGAPADKAGLKAGTTQATIDGNSVTLGGDIIVGINGTRIRNSDDLSTYLEENTLPGQTINLTIVQDNQTINVSLVLSARPAPSSTS